MVISPVIHMGQIPDLAVLDSLADFICGDDSERFPIYRSDSYPTRFFKGVGINATHDGATRKWWVLEVLKQLQASDVEKVILRLVDLREYKGDQNQLKLAVHTMNQILLMENLTILFNGTQPILKRPDQSLSFDGDEILSYTPSKNEEEFLEKEFESDININELGLDSIITTILQARVDEVLNSHKKAHLGAIFLMGSTLEGMLLGFALKDQPKFMASKSSPKDKSGAPKKIYDWKLGELIDVAADLKLLGLDVKKFSHVLRDFRNYIHPHQQMSQGFNPDQRTVDICWQVFKAAFSQLKESGEA